MTEVKEGVELEVTIGAVGKKGDGVAKVDDYLIFVPGTEEGQTVKVKVTKVLDKVAFAETEGYVKTEDADDVSDVDAIISQMENDPEPEDSDDDDDDDGDLDDDLDDAPEPEEVKEQSSDSDSKKEDEKPSEEPKSKEDMSSKEEAKK